MMGPLNYPAHYRKTLTRWYTPNCPHQDECSVSNWAETDQCRSYDSEYKCRVKIYEHLKSGCHDTQSYPDCQLWRWAETAQVAKCPDEGLWLPDDLQKPEHEEIAVYHLKYNGPFAKKKRPRVPLFRDEEDADLPLSRPKLFAKAAKGDAGAAESREKGAVDEGVAIYQVICAG